MSERRYKARMTPAESYDLHNNFLRNMFGIFGCGVLSMFFIFPVEGEITFKKIIGGLILLFGGGLIISGLIQEIKMRLR